MIKDQRGTILTMVLIFLAMGALVLIPTLNLTVTGLKFYRVSRESTGSQYALDAITQQALWMMENFDDVNPFQDCDDPPDGTSDSFADCVAKAAPTPWVLTTQPTGGPYETQVNKVNNQDTTITIEVPGALAALPEPSPAPAPGSCIFAWVTQEPTWVQIDEPVTYSIHVMNCSSDVSAKNVRRVVVLLDPAFNYEAGTSGGSLFQGWPLESSMEPEVSRCDGAATAPDPDYPGCQADDDSLLLAWPDATNVLGGSEKVTLNGGDPGETKVITFQATPSSWGVFHIDVSLCHFAASPSGCDTEISGDTYTNVAPVAVGMFNIKGKARGHAFGASSKLDSGGSALISKQPE